MKEIFTIELIASNHSGVLNRVAGVYAKRGCNIGSLTAAEAEKPAYSRIIITAEGGDYMKNQVLRQLEKLHDVKAAVLHENGGADNVLSVTNLD